MTFKQDSGRCGVRDHQQVGPIQLWRQKGLGRTATLAIDVGDLVQEGATLLGTVVIGIQRPAIERRCLDEHVVERAGMARIGDVQRPALAMPGVAQLLVVFRAFEERQHFVVAPARVAQ